MRIGRVATAAGTVDVRWSADGPVPISSPLRAFAVGEEPVDIGAPLVGARLLPAAAPALLVGIAQNGPSHVAPVQAWLKSPRTIVADGVPVRLRRDAGTPVAEAEIAVVIGRDTTGLTARNAHEYILGVTAVNDLSSPDRTAVDPRNFESKSGVGYTPLGAWIDTDLVAAATGAGDLVLSLEIDGVEVARTDAAALPVPISECLAYLAAWTPLGPGDVIMTGAPFSSSPIAAGQRVDVRVGEIRLTTPTR